MPLRFHPQHPVRSVKALRFLHSLGPIDRPKMFHALFRAYWIDNLDIADSAVLLGIVNSVFSDRRITSADLEEIVSNNETYKNALRDATDLIVSRGAVGVPDCFVPDDRFPGGGRMFWGGDRFHFVAGAVAEARVPGSLVPISSPQQTVLPRTPLSKPTHLDFYFDLASPWAYLAFTQLPRLLAEAGPLLTITLKPVSLATVFKKIGAPAAPSDAKRALQAADLQSWVSYWSHLPYPDGHKEPVDCRVPRKAPRSEHALRLAVAALRSSGMTTPESEAWKTISLLCGYSIYRSNSGSS